MLLTLHMRLLGDWNLVYGQEPVTGVTTARVQSLLAYLVLHRGAHHARQHLAFLFWPDVSESQARNNLRQLLHQLRHALPDADHFLHADASTLYWRAEAPINLDVSEFEHAVAAANAAERTGDRAGMRSALAHAVDVYRGDLLLSCYDEWIAPERERLCQHFLRALERLIGVLEGQRDYTAAIAYAQRLVRHDPLREESYRYLMRLHAVNDDRASALRVYHECATALERELAVEPSPATRETYERLLHVDARLVRPTPSPVFVAAAPLIGRQPEWEQLQAAWQRAADGRSHFALVTGEAGIGKSRLAEELLTWASQQGYTTAKTRAYATEGWLSYAPVADWLRSDALRSTLAQLDPVMLSEVARLLPELLVQWSDLPQPEPLTEHWQRQRFFETLARAVLQASQPLLLLFDDLQWCDQETLEWLHYLLRCDHQARLLVVGTVRTEDVGAKHPLMTLLFDLRSAEQLTELALGPLDAAETTQLAAHAAGRALDPEEANQLYHETEGNPLFVVETIRAGLASADQSLAIAEQQSASTVHPLTSNRQRLPPKVYAVIAARLAQLSDPARELASLAATIGRAFTLNVLAQASDSDEDNFVRELDELWQRRIIREQGSNAYDFSHDKIREVAYAEASTAHRRLLHRRVAQALESIYAAHLDPVSAQVAAHYEHAGIPDLAIRYYQHAAEVAQRVYANEEAISLLNRGLALLGTLPPSQERDARELALQTALGVSFVAAKGYGSAEVMAVYSRARALCQQFGQPPSPPVLRGLAIASVVRSEFQRAHDLGDQLLSLAERDHDSVLLVESHYVLGVTLFWKGIFVPARSHLDQALAHYDSRHTPTHLAQYGQDPRAICLSRLAANLWYLGYPDQAAQRAEESVALARELAHPFSLAYVLIWATMLHHHRRDARATQAQAAAAITLSYEHQLGIWLPQGTVLEGWTLVEQGAIEAGIAQMREGMAAFRATGATYMLPYFHDLLAEQYGKLGNIERGLTLLAEALAAVNRTGGRWYEAELERRKGELLLLRGDDAAAEEAFRRALAVARYQGAKTIELRAATSLARLWQGQNKRAEAQQMLEDLYTWFAEGFDTPDLMEARSLLEQP